MKKSDLPVLGSPLNGGFFSGIINVNGVNFAIATAPKALGESRQILLPNAKMVEGALSTFDSVANTIALAEAGSPAALWVQSLVIDGNSNWVLPARDVLEIQYRNHKPTAEENYCSFRDGDNPSSVPPGHLYTEESPAKTSIEIFQEGGSEAFEADWYISSTQYSTGYVCGQDFRDGGQGGSDVTSERRVRAVSLIQLND
jgi:hypothetical protein